MRAKGKRTTSDYLLESLARKVCEGVWKPGEQIPAIRSLADRFGVARATMDAAVLRATRVGLLETVPRRGTRVARDGGLTPGDCSDRLGRSSQAPKVALIASDWHEAGRPDEHDEILATVDKMSRKRGWTTQAIYWPVSRRAAFPRFLVDGSFDGAFCIATRPERLMPLHYMRERRFPVVVYNRRIMGIPLPTVMFDEYGAVQQLGRMLYELGHRRITMLAAVSAAVAERFDSPQLSGWLDFCRQHDLLAHWDEPLYVTAHVDPQRALAAYFRRRPLPTAVILGPGMAVPSRRELSALGVRVPEEVSVAATHCPPASGPRGPRVEVTCMRPDMERMAECSLELLARMMSGEAYPPPLRLPYTLMRTDSIASPPPA